MAPLQSKWACCSLGQSLLRQNFSFGNIQDDLFGKKVCLSRKKLKPQQDGFYVLTIMT